MLCSMVMFLLIILLCVGSLKVLLLSLYFSSYPLMIFFFFQIVFYLFSLLLTPIFFFVIKTWPLYQEWLIKSLSSPGLTQTSLLFILISPNSSSSIHDINRSNLRIKHLNTPIARVQEDKFLGNIIHENLSYKLHITSSCDKVTKVIGISVNRDDT